MQTGGVNTVRKWNILHNAWFARRDLVGVFVRTSVNDCFHKDSGTYTIYRIVCTAVQYAYYYNTLL